MPNIYAKAKLTHEKEQQIDVLLRKLELLKKVRHLKAINKELEENLKTASGEQK